MQDKKWLKFKISDLFNVELASGDIKLENVKSGDIPLVSSGETNNGIVGYIDKGGDGISKIFKKGKITVDMFCNAFYQDQDFYAVSHGRINILTSKTPITENASLFITSLINAEKYKFSYGRALYSNTLANMYIHLPAKASGKPDYSFMEKSIKEIIYNKKSNLNSLDKLLNTKNIKLKQYKERETWNKFKISDLFDKFEIGKANSNLLSEGAEYFYLGAKKSDNCVMQKCGKTTLKKHNGNCIVFICNGQGSVGYTNYMDKPFIASTDLVMAYSKNLNKYNAMFLVTIFDKERPKYSFGRKWKRYLYDTEVLLPSKNNKPDWQYMEDYIKSLPYGDKI